MKRMFLAFSFVFLAGPSWAHQPADGLIHANFGPLLYQTHKISHDFHSPLLGSFGMVVEGDLDDNGGFELGIFHMNKLFSMEKEDKIITERGERLYVTIGYRHWFGSWWSAGLGFFSSYQMGEAKTVRNDFTTPNPPKTSARDVTEYGFELSVQREIWRMDQFAIVADGRYSYSVTPKPDEDANHYGLMVAFKYFLQGKRPPEEEEDEE